MSGECVHEPFTGNAASPQGSLSRDPKGLVPETVDLIKEREGAREGGRWGRLISGTSLRALDHGELGSEQLERRRGTVVYTTSRFLRDLHAQACPL